MNTVKDLTKVSLEKMQKLFNSFPEKFKKKIYSPKTRFIVIVLLIIINVYNYKHVKQRYSKVDCPTHNFLFKLSCSKTYFYLYLIIIILELIFLYHLEKNITIAKFPKYWWLILGLICIMLIINFEDKTELVEKDGTFNPPPLKTRRYFGRKFWTFFAILLSLLSLLIEMINKKNKFKIILGIRVINTLLLCIIYYYTINFSSCKYNLPDSWRS